MIIRKKIKQPSANLLSDENQDVDLMAPQSEALVELPKKEKTQRDALKEFEKIDISNIEFNERVERRRGERRRGYRRIDERTLVSRAQEEAHSIRELAAKEGYKNGLEDAGAEIEKLKTALQDFLSSKFQMYDELMPHILEIAIEVSRKIIKKEVELSQEVLKNIVNEVLSALSNSEEKITIKVASDDLDFAKASLPEIVSINQLDAKVVVISDDNVEKGSCVVISNNGVVDANFSTQLEIIQNAFGIYKGGL